MKYAALIASSCLLSVHFLKPMKRQLAVANNYSGSLLSLKTIGSSIPHDFQPLETKVVKVPINKQMLHITLTLACEDMEKSPIYLIIPTNTASLTIERENKFLNIITDKNGKAQIKLKEHYELHTSN